MRCFILVIVLSQLALLPRVAEGQSILSSTIVWEADQATDVNKGATTPFSCQFVSNGRQSVEWVQRKGTVSTVYKVASVVGDWGDVKTNGSVVYLLERDGKSFKMKFERSTSGVLVTMTFAEKATKTSQLRFNIKSVR